jgi:hypothetical protein
MTQQNNTAIRLTFMNSHADPRALQRAQNAETQRMRRADRGRSEEEQDQQHARCVIPGVIERESAQ